MRTLREQCFQGRRQLQKCGVDTHGERAEREPITGVWGQSPQRGPGAEPLVRGLRGRSPPEAENLLAFGCPTEAANLPHSPYFAKSLTPAGICDTSDKKLKVYRLPYVGMYNTVLYHQKAVWN